MTAVALAIALAASAATPEPLLAELRRVWTPCDRIGERGQCPAGTPELPVQPWLADSLTNELKDCAECVSLLSQAAEDATVSAIELLHRNKIALPSIALDRVVSAGGSTALDDDAAIALAEVLLRRGSRPNARLVYLLNRAIQNNAASVAPVRTLVDALDTPAAITDLCERLVQSGRSLQGRECVLAAGRRLAHPDELLFDVYASLPVLTREDLERLRQDGARFDFSLSIITGCFKPQPPSRVDWIGFTLPHSKPHTGGLFLKLALGTEGDAQKECFLEEGAIACLNDALSYGEGCSSYPVIARYAEWLWSRKSPKYNRFVAFVFNEKAGLYGALYRASPDTPQYRSIEWGLLNLHLALANIYASGVPQGVSPYNRAYHVDRARTFWSKLHSGEQLPARYLSSK